MRNCSAVKQDGVRRTNKEPMNFQPYIDCCPNESTVVARSSTLSGIAGALRSSQRACRQDTATRPTPSRVIASLGSSGCGASSSGNDSTARVIPNRRPGWSSSIPRSTASLKAMLRPAMCSAVSVTRSPRDRRGTGRASPRAPSSLSRGIRARPRRPAPGPGRSRRSAPRPRRAA